MKNLLVLVGCAGTGKSTWVKDNDLEKFTIATDKLRLLFSAPTLNLQGEFCISQQNNGKVLNLLFELLEFRMINGNFTVIDATNLDKHLLNNYTKLCNKYNYKLYLKVFNTPLTVLEDRNEVREEYKRVPNCIIEKHFNDLQSLDLSKFNKINEIDEINEKIKTVNLSHYQKVYILGDIHGCMKHLQQFFQTVDIEKDCFIFTGDYIDRGKYNDEVLNFLCSNIEKENFILLEGNHERHLRKWVNDEEIISDEFKINTLEQINCNCNKTQIKNLLTKLKTHIKFSFNERIFVVCHGGISNPNFDFINAKDLINGVGKYEDMEKNAYSFESLSCKEEKETILIHGHRNINNQKIQVNDNVFNLEGFIEYDGALRIIKLQQNNIEKLEIKEAKDYSCNLKIVEKLKQTNLIKEKQFENGYFSSFNFTRQVFYDRLWNKETVKARGLFVRNDGKIIARSYDKFFNIEERDETKLENIDFKFPINVYEKYNGYLGILGFDDKKGELIFCSKSTVEGDFANWFKELFYKKIEDVERFKLHLQKNNCSAVFEVILPEKDPHIIDEKEEKLVLLDLIKNEFEYQKTNFNELNKFAKCHDVKCKKRIIVISDKQKFLNFYNAVKDFSIEGVVYEDQNNFQVKQKTNFYINWKYLRTQLERIKKGKNWVTQNKEQQEFIDWFLKQEQEIKELNLLTLRRKFYENRI